MPDESIKPVSRGSGRRRWLRIVVMLAVLLALAVFIDPREVGNALSRTSAEALVLATILLSLDRVVMGLKW